MRLDGSTGRRTLEVQGRVKQLDGIPVHRPERRWPVRPPQGPIVLAAPPLAPEPEAGGAWMTLLPLLGSLGIVAFA
jgi:hypothetical protein